MGGTKSRVDRHDFGSFVGFQEDSWIMWDKNPAEPWELHGNDSFTWDSQVQLVHLQQCPQQISVIRQQNMTSSWL